MNKPGYCSVLAPPDPSGAGQRQQWGRLYGGSQALVIATAARQHSAPVVVIAEDTAAAQRLSDELRFYLSHEAGGATPDTPLLSFPDWETLPYDVFSPHQDIVSERLATLYQLPSLSRGVLVVPVQTLMQRLCPRSYLEQNSLMLDQGQRLDLEQMRLRLEQSSYRCVSAVLEHGEFAVRGSLLDLFPMGSSLPYRIELFDDEVDSIRTFNPDSQRSLERVDQVRMLPAREFPFDENGIKQFRQSYRARFEGDPQHSAIYRDVSNGVAPAGIEYYLPLFFAQLSSLFDYLPASSLLVCTTNLGDAAATVLATTDQRYEMLRHNVERQILAPTELLLNEREVRSALDQFPVVDVQSFEHESRSAVNFSTANLPTLTLDPRAPRPSAALSEFLAGFDGRVLFVAETAGRRETLRQTLQGIDIHPASHATLDAFVDSSDRFGIAVAPLEQSVLLEEPPLAVIAETQLFGHRVVQRRRRRRSRDEEAVVRNLAELNVGAPVVHEEHGVARYRGLTTLSVGDVETEFLLLEYADGDRLYVPVSSLHLISRYTGTSPENAPLHKLGSGQWERAKRKATERIRDVAAELLDIYARRQARVGFSYPFDDEQYRNFASAFPFEETADQQAAIDAVVSDMVSAQPMDRLICGDVGFGKTEVAMRAAFVATQAGKQVAVLVPTTLLTQQHLANFQDRFADWPVKIESLSRFRSKKEQTQVLDGLADGTVDIVIGTHKLLLGDVRFKRLGLLIIDEEHRFGVRQKERFKSLRSEVDVLTLTATPIPRTLNMALAGIRDLSIIATPPARRLAVKTFVSEWNSDTIREACLREIQRGGQVYFLHNEVESIHKKAAEVEGLVPEARVEVAHGQMRERDLEHVMSDFYHHRFNVLICTTIIETGIDVPTANTIIINRADRFGLAQLYQLRGRVGRSHHRAYAYLLVPPRAVITADAVKRLEAIESIETLGTGFTLATHDLEIRGAGELLGEEQSGHMNEIGYALYTELLERAVASLKAGREPMLDQPLSHGAEVDLHVPALIPEDYLPDVHERLIMYKRIASAANDDDLRELQVEMIDRFGLLPDQVKILFEITALKLKATRVGIKKLDIGSTGGRLVFVEQPNIDPIQIIELIQSEPKRYRLDGPDKLRINMELPDTDGRLNAVQGLLDTLLAAEAA